MFKEIQTIDGFIIKNKYLINDIGVIKNFKGYIYKPVTRTDGYKFISLELQNGERRNFYIHRLVANVFIQVQKDTSLVVNHKDLNRSNNHFLNLEFITQKENINYSISKGTINNTGENGNTSILNNRQVNDICGLLETNPDIKYREIISILGLPESKGMLDIIGKIKNGKLWLSISKDYIINKRTRSCMNSYSHLRSNIKNLLMLNVPISEMYKIFNIPNTRLDRNRLWTYVNRIKKRNKYVFND